MIFEGHPEKLSFSEQIPTHAEAFIISDGEVTKTRATALEIPIARSEEDLSQDGMLPSRESEFDASWGFSLKKGSSREFSVDVFALPSHGSRKEWCGQWRGRICREDSKHVNGSLDGVDVVGKHVIELYRASCGRIQCPICYEKAAAKMAITIEWRFKHFKFRKDHPEPIHVVASVPESMYDVDAKKLRSIAQKRLKECGVHGGCIIYHPWRQRCASCGGEVEREFGEHLCKECGSPITVWVLGLHFHSIALGWVNEKAVKKMHEKTGWVVHNLGVRKSVRSTAQYQLSHCGVSKGFSNVVWFGSMVRVKYPKIPPETHDCPLCGSKMEKLVLDSWMKTLMKSKLMDDLEEGFYFVDPEMFDYRDQLGDDG
jgi:hypothetical protein